MPVRSLEKLKQYFIAIVPPPPIFDEALELKKYFKEQYNSKASLNSPPHITLHMPFKWKEEKEGELIDSLREFAHAVSPIMVVLHNFSSFPPRVIFMNVKTNQPLEKLQKELQRFCKRELNLFNADYKDLPFHPHLTLAFRDLKKPNYLRAWEEFSTKEYHAEFLADKLSLLKHTGKEWQVLKECILADSGRL
jgi:2'-5' RNA ligase